MHITGFQMAKKKRKYKTQEEVDKDIKFIPASEFKQTYTWHRNNKLEAKAAGYDPTDKLKKPKKKKRR